MDICPIKKQRQSNVPLPSIFIPDELIAEILSSLSVKAILRFKCVSKLWNTLISDSTFIDKHLMKSSQKKHLLVLWRDYGFMVLPFPLYRLQENTSITVRKEDLHCLKDTSNVFGTCNGLICLYTKFFSWSPTGWYIEYSIYLWNPSTRKKSERFGFYIKDNIHDYDDFQFTFGYDDSTKTYKVVAFNKSEVKVYSLGGNDWRNIQCFPVVPLNWEDYDDKTCINNTCINNGVHLSGTINWLGIYNYLNSSYQPNNITHVKLFAIISLDLSTETYKLLPLPQGFVEVPNVRPVVNVLMECLCFSHQENGEFVLWQMKEHGIQESWTQLFKISQQNLPKDFLIEGFQVACLYKNGDTVIFAKKGGRHSFFRGHIVIYNLRDKKGERITVKGQTHLLAHANLYIESLVAVC